MVKSAKETESRLVTVAGIAMWHLGLSKVLQLCAMFIGQVQFPEAVEASYYTVGQGLLAAPKPWHAKKPLSHNCDIGLYGTV